MSWFIAIEWDGVKPPSTFYRRLHGMGLWVRGDKSKSPLARRETNGFGVVFQEGAIIVPSESFARAIALMAQRGIVTVDKNGASTRIKARAVSIGEVNLVNKIEMTDEDREALRRIESVLGKRGRPDPERDWAITCFEEMEMYHTKTPSVFNCPHCGGLRVRIRPGHVEAYRDPGGDVFNAWKRLRFVTGHWEPAPVRGAAQLPPAELLVADESERNTLKHLSELAPDLHSKAGWSRDEALGVLDAVFVARARWSAERRMQARIAAATRYFQMGGSPARISLAETSRFDLLDAAGPLGAETVAAYLLK